MDLITIKILLFSVFLAMSAFYAGIETALTSLTTLSIAKLKEKHPKQRASVEFWEHKPNELIAAVLVGTNLAVIGAGVLSASLSLDFVSYYSFTDPKMLAVVPAAATLLILFFGEIAPKTISRYLSEPVSIMGLKLLIISAYLFAPLTKSILMITEKFIGVFNRRLTRESPFLRPEELKVLLTSDETMPLSSAARKIMKNILDFGKTRIERVMVPKNRMQAVNLNQDREKVIEQIIEKGYSRIPVYRDNLDNIAGIIYSKDLTLSLREGSLFLIDDLIIPAYFVPESARIDKVLREFKTGHHHMAVIVDEFGSTSGLATIEDLVEEIVGEIWDEYDIQEKTIFPMPDGSHLLRAAEYLQKVNEELKLDLPAQEFHTVSGWVLDLFGRIPKIGEKVRWGSLEVEIVDADRKKITRVKIKKVEGGQQP